MENIIGIVWIIGIAIGFIITAWKMGKHNITHPKSVNGGDALIFIGVFGSVFWPLAIMMMCIFYPLSWIEKLSERYYKKKIQKSEDS